MPPRAIEAAFEAWGQFGGERMVGFQPRLVGDLTVLTSDSFGFADSADAKVASSFSASPPSSPHTPSASSSSSSSFSDVSSFAGFPAPGGRGYNMVDTGSAMFHRELLNRYTCDTNDALLEWVDVYAHGAEDVAFNVVAAYRGGGVGAGSAAGKVTSAVALVLPVGAECRSTLLAHGGECCAPHYYATPGKENDGGAVTPATTSTTGLTTPPTTTPGEEAATADDEESTNSYYDVYERGVGEGGESLPPPHERWWERAHILELARAAVRERAGGGNGGSTGGGVLEAVLPVSRLAVTTTVEIYCDG